ncbi:hypothetical protein MMC19_006871 [Ptychographa xylographoides]|nr:hypothetical protein [Ptychographa xylographoides]
MCGKLFSRNNSSGALNTYNTPANAGTYYSDYTSYTANEFTAIYVCPDGKYPTNTTGAEIYAADNQLKCRITLNYCYRCTNVVNGRIGDGSGDPRPGPPPSTADIPHPRPEVFNPDIHNGGNTTSSPPDTVAGQDPPMAPKSAPPPPGMGGGAAGE